MIELVVTLTVLGSIGAGALAYLGFRKDARIKRAIRKAPHVKVSEFVEGTPAKLIGKLRFGTDTLVAPLTGRSCAFYQVNVEQQRGSDHNTRWPTVITDIEFVDFFLEDASGRALIRLQAAEVVVVKDEHSKSGTFDKPTPQEQAFLDKHNVEGEAWGFNKILRYREGVLEEGEIVAVMGLGAWEADPNPGAVPGDYRGTARRLIMRTEGGTPLYVSDDPRTVR